MARQKGGERPGNYASDYERSLMQRILAETTEFPLEFRNWLKRFIIDEVKQEAIDSGGGPGDATGFDPKVWMPGIIMPLAMTTAPPHSLPCNGQEVSRVTYAALFSVIHTTHGSGDGTNTFNLPDYRDRALYGQGSQVPFLANDTKAFGQRGPKHHHAVSIAGSMSGSMSGGTDSPGDHGHNYRRHTEVGITVQQGTAGTLLTVGNTGGFDEATGGGGNHSHGVSVSGSVSGTIAGDTTGGLAQDVPGYAGVAYVITTGAIS